MKRLTTLFLLSSFTLSGLAQTNPLWLRYPAISPDGQTIAFSYKGDLFTVPVTGGMATQLTTNPSYDAAPVWSPDGRRIAFLSMRAGNGDVYVVDRMGGEPRRLTTNSAEETPMTWLNDSTILFKSSGMPTAQSIYFPGTYGQVYSVTLSGSRPRLFSTVHMEDVSVNANGDVLYHDKKGYEDEMRKHHQSSITRDIWLERQGKFTKQTSFGGEDRTPRWAPDGQAFYYLSEQDSTFNVYKRNVGEATARQLTHFKKNPVRFLSVATNGTLCYAWDGEIYTQTENGAPQKLKVTVVADRNDVDLNRQTLTGGATEIAVSPNGKEVAFVVHGDVYVTSVDYRTTKQVTDTPWQERGVNFSPDGRSIVYASERNGLWQIYQSTIKNADEKLFTYATELEERQLVSSGHTAQQPKYSPDGQSVAFLEDRATLKAVDVKSLKERTLMDGKYLYSYSDGDLGYQWSPDSRWILSDYMGNGGWQNRDVALVSADGKGEVYNLTQSGYNDGNAKWVLGGKAMIFQSDRAGYRSHGSWGSENDAYIMFFDLDAYDQFRMSKEERALFDEAEKAKASAKAAKESDPAVKKDLPKEKKLEFDLENCRDRVIRLTVNSSNLGDAVLDKKGENLYYQAAFEGGYDLWKHDLKENSTRIVMKNIGGGAMIADSTVQNLYMCNGGIRRYTISSNSTKNIDFEAKFNYKPYEERAYLFDHVWKQVKDKFYDPRIHGVDWDGYRDIYGKFLPYINNNYDFRDLLSEMLGELNASHTGARYNVWTGTPETAQLGLFYDNSYDGDGLKIEEVIKRGPFAVKTTGVGRGCIVEAIDGEKILKGKDYNHLLDGKAGRRVRVSVYNPDTKKRFDVEVKAISKGAQNELLYKRWVDRNRHLVDSLSNGRIAYVHVKAMNSESFRNTFSELLSEANRQKDAVIIDDRHNGGGWLHDDLCTLLSGREYQKFVPHGKYIAKDPWNKWTKPSCVLVCEDDYSNGHGFPMVYKTLGIGKVIGAPVAGTMTAVWWETLMDRSLVFGIPQVGCQLEDGSFAENQTLVPDVVVYNTPEADIQGHDIQLERAVKEMMGK